MTNRSLVAPADRKRRRSGTDQEVLWVRFPVAAGFCHSKEVKNGSGPYLHDTQDEVGTRNITGWPGVSIM